MKQKTDKVILFLDEVYKVAASDPEGIIESSSLPESIKLQVDTIVNSSEKSKGVMTVAFTSIVYKSLNPDQDVRNHQTSIANGYSGRTFDSSYITPFLRSKSFPCMSESGWLTRSLEQKHPYNRSYPGAITPKSLKNAFLGLLETISTTPIDTKTVVLYFLSKLIISRDSKQIPIAKPANLTIGVIIDSLVKHFNAPYKSHGASRLPVLAFYAIYQVLTQELKRFDGKKLLPLENHTSADSQSGRLGDIDILDSDGNSFEAVEIKFGREIDHNIVEIAKDKIISSKVTRYYILSTKEIRQSDMDRIEKTITQVKNTHGCQIVVNGIVPSLKYYMRLIDAPAKFVEYYAALLASDESINYEHRKAWNDIIGSLK